MERSGSTAAYRWGLLSFSRNFFWKRFPPTTVPHPLLAKRHPATNTGILLITGPHIGITCKGINAKNWHLQSDGAAMADLDDRLPWVEPTYKSVYTDVSSVAYLDIRMYMSHVYFSTVHITSLTNQFLKVL